MNNIISFFEEWNKQLTPPKKRQKTKQNKNTEHFK